MMQAMHGGLLKSETAFTNPASYMYGGERNPQEGHFTVVDTSIPNFSSESNNQPLNDPLLDAEDSTFRFLGQIPQNFSLSDLIAYFYQSSEILVSYDRSPFLVPNAENFQDSREREEYQGERAMALLNGRVK